MTRAQAHTRLLKSLAAIVAAHREGRSGAHLIHLTEIYDMANDVFTEIKHPRRTTPRAIRPT
jgi:hypothetical protein